ncbi:hypothetical protein C8R44DRAFT_851657 [Mycena epipterygia]|nr:hypothetical protein C8R44DRAFT_851657 [Mycena epipterygia]
MFDKQLLTLTRALELHKRPSHLPNEIVLHAVTDLIAAEGAALCAHAALTVLKDSEMGGGYQLDVDTFDVIFSDTN